ncbi:MAG TPA: Bax inhibitor-1 family protein [Holophagaceae bacterium]|nr:Bax inhibitor-1 family protein [Holophagaceae bacterium]
MDYQQSWPNAQSQIEARVQFVRKVYLWLMAGFGVACAGAVASPFVAQALIPVTGNFFIWALFIAQMGAIFFARAVARKKPLNLLAYGVFTFVSGIIAGILSMVVASHSGFGIVLAALGMTAAAFLTLTIVALVSKKDFSFLGSFVMVGIAIMFFGSLIAALFHLPTLSLIASGAAVIACSAKVLWDTSAMLRTEDLSDPLFFALSLFVSLYNIFIALLNILGRRR